MRSKQLYTIIQEFRDRKCILKLNNGDLITAFVGEVVLRAGSSEPEVNLWDENNINRPILLDQIFQ